jgi:hypothetical protein
MSPLLSPSLVEPVVVNSYKIQVRSKGFWASLAGTRDDHIPGPVYLFPTAAQAHREAQKLCPRAFERGTYRVIGDERAPNQKSDEA